MVFDARAPRRAAPRQRFCALSRESAGRPGITAFQA